MLRELKDVERTSKITSLFTNVFVCLFLKQCVWWKFTIKTIIDKFVIFERYKTGLTASKQTWDLAELLIVRNGLATFSLPCISLWPLDKHAITTVCYLEYVLAVYCVKQTVWICAHKECLNILLFIQPWLLLCGFVLMLLIVEYHIIYSNN